MRRHRNIAAPPHNMRLDVRAVNVDIHALAQPTSTEADMENNIQALAPLWIRVRAA